MLFFCFLCVSGVDSGGWMWEPWRRVKSGASCLARALNPCDQESVLGSVRRSMNHAKNNACNALHSFAHDWWWDVERFNKDFQVFAWGMFSVCCALLVVQPPFVCTAALMTVPLSVGCVVFSLRGIDLAGALAQANLRAGAPFDARMGG